MHSNASQQRAITRRELLMGVACWSAASQALRGQAALSPIGLDHLNIRVANVRRSLEFYARLFGSEVKRVPKLAAHPTSIEGEHYFVKLGESVLVISPVGPPDAPGIDHIGFAVNGFEAEAIARRLVGLNPQWEGPWVKDPDGRILQIAMPDWFTRYRGVIPVRAEPAFRPTRITHVTFGTARLEECAAYYQKLVGGEVGSGPTRRFRLGRSELTLGPETKGEHWCVGVAGSDSSATLRKLKALGVAARVPRNEKVVEFHDPDGITVQIVADQA